MVGLPNKPMGVFLLKNDQHLGCEMGGNPPFKETSIYLGIPWKSLPPFQ